MDLEGKQASMEEASTDSLIEWTDEARRARQARSSRSSEFKTTPGVLVCRTQNGDQRAAVILCDLYWWPVYHYLCRKGAAADEAVDATQDSFCQLLDSSKEAKWKPTGSFRAWLRTVAYRYLSKLRSQRARPKPAQGRALVALRELPPDPESLVWQRRLALLCERAWQAAARDYAGENGAKLLEHLYRTICEEREKDDPTDVDLCREFGKSRSYIAVDRNALVHGKLPYLLSSFVRAKPESEIRARSTSRLTDKQMRELGDDVR